MTSSPQPFRYLRPRLSAALCLAALVLLGMAGRPVLSSNRAPLGLAARDSLPKEVLFPVPFAAGETLLYTVAWLKIEGGEMTIATTRETSADGVPVHRIVLTADSNDYVSKFYPVRTRYETWVDARDFQPLRFEKHAREGRYSSDEVEEFDLGRRIAAWREERTPLPPRVQDIISSFYYLRTQPLEPGKSVQVDMFSRGKIYKLAASVLSREHVETEVGGFEALKVQPLLREADSEEDRNKGKLFLWFSDDARRLPVMAKTILPIGSVTARLKRVSTREREPGESESGPRRTPVREHPDH